MKEKGQPSPLNLGVGGGLRIGQGLSFGDVGLGKVRLVFGGRATVPGTMGTGRELYRGQWRASVGRNVDMTNLPTDAPFPRLPFIAAELPLAMTPHASMPETT
jgi:hypothetical protein